MQIIVHWYSGSPYSGYSAQTLLNYESTEALYIHLEEAVQKYFKESEQHCIDMANWHERRRVATRKAFSTFDEPAPKQPEREIYLEGVKFDLSEYIVFSELEKKSVIQMPEIQTLQEWFDENKEN